MSHFFSVLKSNIYFPYILGCTAAHWILVDLYVTDILVHQKLYLVIATKHNEMRMWNDYFLLLLKCWLFSCKTHPFPSSVLNSLLLTQLHFYLATLRSAVSWILRKKILWFLGLHKSNLIDLKLDLKLKQWDEIEEKYKPCEIPSQSSTETRFAGTHALGECSPSWWMWGIVE